MHITRKRKASELKKSLEVNVSTRAQLTLSLLQFKGLQALITPNSRVHLPNNRRTSTNDGKRSLTQEQRFALRPDGHPSQKILQEAEERHQNQTKLQSRCCCRPPLAGENNGIHWVSINCMQSGKIVFRAP